MGRFTRRRSIFEEKDALRDDYEPESLEARDEELDAYTDALQPVVDGWQPNNIFLYGKTGVGKTAATEYLLSELAADCRQYDDVDLSIVHVNCNTLNSSYQIAVHLVNELRDPGRQISTTGYPEATVFDMLYDELESIGGTVLIVLDEIDNIGTDDDILYELPRARSNGYLESVKPGLIGISNNFAFRDQLSPKVKDTLCEEELHFSPYDAGELRQILRSRAELAIRDDALDQDVIPLCAAIAAQDTGSARQAITLLLRAGELASNDDAEAIAESHVRTARNVIETERVQEGMRQLTVHGHLVLLAVTAHATRDETPVRMRDLYPRYRRYCDHLAVDPITKRSVHDHLGDLTMQSVLERHERNAGARGNYYEYALEVPIAAALDALEDVGSFDDIVADLRHRAPQS
ncbi:orc1/cdc6 family replication initiation protein [Natronoarchaeum rubrum]|uniref:orc1/cdc6 family replication initiation protein n=1 Tax=Natronoarchaeum rubrum TaxID=755311 RepID=UPI002112C25E|nr:orc1/cdc6 family replication initiation protein [Natronoarchaeum rubrum]HMB49328.1 orc1/cdc6 family replication initiation protein [Natronoarchaeum rubrum]